MQRNEEGILIEEPLGICPACGQLVYESEQDGDGPVWTCPADLHPDHIFADLSKVTDEQKHRDGDFSNCPSAHDLDNGHCELLNHLPLHAACYNSDTWRY